ncbi:DUF262 domain-containing HNH endonuclease family protein [Cyanobacterium sp. Dongsha4]|uniref:DUF262 domain-containing protein n=1 Tax=Cyanobacterium sp. DS4 TaxID=2878255 RepID=UPI002E818EA7|nr:DUF262 domain-containing HNH endonuclease family protein [Cyanobacterium sp. Dongsha4]WVL01403.1 DUF262 domain-containing HNH endonuclease family protein [Cyanobacterium sp. Dongsha4]
MNIDPVYTSVGVLFKSQSTFFIPKYQRAYAWNSESVNDFITDLKTCFEKRKQGLEINHFFGGILSVKYPVSGAFDKHKYEIIDGQQRIATFTLLVACLIKYYKCLTLEAKKIQDTNNENIIERRFNNLLNRFVQFEQEIQRIVNSVDVLRLSNADNDFYRELIRDHNPSPSRDSHNKMLSAYEKLNKGLKEILADANTIENKIDDLEIIEKILDNDFTVLHMVTDKKEDAFRLFQVINDRGTNLTDGDLLRAKTLELLEPFCEQQNIVEKLWDNILADSPSDTSNYFNWIYDSFEGNRPKQNAVFDMFLDRFFPEHKKHQLTSDDAEKIKDMMEKIHKQIIKCRKLVEGQWLYPEKQPITAWDRTRLNILLVELGHTLSIPLLLAASELDHKKFSEIVQMIEKTFFRYKLICNEHITPLKTIYAKEAINIRQNIQSYQIENLRKELNELLQSKVPDQKFKTALRTLQYQETGASNKPLKYFLMTIEYYYQWFKQGANGQPDCLDKSRVYDFAGTSIEHIYPRNPANLDKDNNLEPLKNSLGNLTIMDPQQNNIGDNDPFINKKSLYKNSSVVLTQEIGNMENWTATEIENHQNLLIEIAISLFNLQT